MKIGKFEVKPSMPTGLALGALGLLEMWLTSKQQESEMEMLKADLKKELLDDIMKQSSK